MSRPIHAVVDPSAIAANLRRLRGWLREHGCSPRIWATVKADAYGHGIARVAPALAGADGLAVLDPADAQACRDAGWTGPILLLGGPYGPGDFDLDVGGPLHLSIIDLRQLDWLGRARLRKPPFVWLRSTGDLHHCGLDDDEYRRAWHHANELVGAGRVTGVGHMNHYAAADQPGGIAPARAAFEALTAGLPGPRSTCNSAALLGCPSLAAADQWVRPGLALFGASPLPGRSAAQFGLQPAMSLHSTVVAVQRVRAGEPVGYGGAYAAPADMRIGIVACGYADGYPRSAPTGTPVQVDGAPTRTLGRVAMDTLAVDLTHLPQAGVGSRVLLWGQPELPAERVAEAAGTIAAQLFTSLIARVPLRIAHCAQRDAAKV